MFMRIDSLIVALSSTPALHVDPVARLALALAVILVAAKVGSELATRLGQPAVLGELCVGVIVGNLVLVGYTGLDYLKTDHLVDIFARLGVILLLFEVGLGSTVREMLNVGASAFLVGCMGVAAPFALGWAVGAWLLPEAGSYVHAFLGATLSATSVGITARVLKDLGLERSTEARVILGAAIIDDVLGLVVLAAIAAVIVAADTGTPLSYGALALTVAKAVVFLAGALLVGVRLSPRLFSLASKLRAGGVLLALSLALCFFLSWLANAMGLAAIVGAFAAGLVLEEAHFHEFAERGERSIHELVAPIASFVTPIFFVVIGMRTDLRSLARADVLLLALALTVAAVVGKQACALAVVGTRANRLMVGIGMTPRGEVTLIFAGIGLGLTVGGRPVLDQGLFSAIVVVVMVTTVLTPPALAWAFARTNRAERHPVSGGAPATRRSRPR
jgi:Kef-type K+ transport system membrane component KefB